MDGIIIHDDVIWVASVQWVAVILETPRQVGLVANLKKYAKRRKYLGHNVRGGRTCR